METIIGGLKINYHVLGQGESFLILHGWGSSSGKWEKVIDLLVAQNIKVIIPDLPGFGNSQKPPESWGLDDYCDFVKNFVDFLNIKDFYLLGHSFGGGIAVKYCIKFPQDIKKVFFVSAAFIRRKTIKKWFLSRISKILKVFSFLPFFTIARKAFYKFVVGGDYQYSTGVMKESFSKVAGENLSEKLNLINIPAIIIWGDKDDATLVQDAYFMKQKIKNSQLEIFEDMKHTPYLECPEKLAESIIKFINK